MEKLSVSIPAPDNFSFTACIDYMSHSPLECLFQVEKDSVIRPLRVGENKVLMEISFPDENGIQLILHGEKDVIESSKEEAILFVREWFDLETDINSFYRLAEADPTLSRLTKAYRGLRLIGVPDLFEALCWAIVGQQVNLTFAYQLKRSLAEQYGEPSVWKDTTLWLFPKPEQLVHATIDELRDLKLSRVKSTAIVEVARQIASGDLSREKLLSLSSFDEAEKLLVSIVGIGPWTAHYVRMRCLRDPSAFLIGDAGLINAIKIVLGLNRKPTRTEIQQQFVQWKGWEAYATFYLWRSLEKTHVVQKDNKAR